MRLSWNEVRARAAAFAEDWQDAAYEKGDTQSFYNAFFDVFGVRRRNVARFEAHVAKHKVIGSTPVTRSNPHTPHCPHWPFSITSLISAATVPTPCKHR